MYRGGRETKRRLLHVSHLILLFSRHSQPSPKSMSILLGGGRHGKIKHRGREEEYGNNSAYVILAVEYLLEINLSWLLHAKTLGWTQVVDWPVKPCHLLTAKRRLAVTVMMAGTVKPGWVLAATWVTGELDGNFSTIMTSCCICSVNISGVCRRRYCSGPPDGTEATGHRKEETGSHSRGKRTGGRRRSVAKQQLVFMGTEEKRREKDRQKVRV